MKQVKREKKTCLYCNAEIVWIPGVNKGKYCSNQHQMLHQTKIKVESGKSGFSGCKTYMKRYMAYKCHVCSISEWNGKPITLHCDHIDGNRNNNILENLRWLCPNCHSQTDTWCIKNESCDGKARRTEARKRQEEKKLERTQ
jgi:hypothetical protein